MSSSQNESDSPNPNWSDETLAALVPPSAAAAPAFAPRHSADDPWGRPTMPGLEGSAGPMTSPVAREAVGEPTRPKVIGPLPPFAPPLEPAQPTPRTSIATKTRDRVNPRSVRGGSPFNGRQILRMLGELSGVNLSRDVQDYLDLHRQLTAAVPSGRRIVVLSIDPSQGSTTVAALLANALAARRDDPVLVVDAAAASVNPSLHSVLGVEPVRTMRTLAADPPRPSTRADFTGILTKVADDVWLIPADDATRGTGTGGAAPDAGTYSAAITPFARYFDITVTDVSSRPGAGTAELLLNRAHALCLVTSGDEAGFAAVTDRLQALRDQGGIPWAGRTVVVANQASSTAPRTGRRRLGHRSNDIPVVTLDFDPVLGPGFAQRLSELAPETHRTAMRLAAEILGTAMPSTV